jgi:hypothetical protein
MVIVIMHRFSDIVKLFKRHYTSYLLPTLKALGSPDDQHKAKCGKRTDAGVRH